MTMEAKWVKIAGELRKQIEQGKLKPGRKIPVRRLADRTGVAPQTAAKALAALAKEGWLRHYPCAGYVVRQPDA